MFGSSISDFIGLLLLDIVQLLLPALLVLLAIGLLYTFLQVINARFIEESNQSFSRLFAGGVSKTIILFIEKLPAILIILAMVTGFSLIMNLGNSFYKIYENQKRIKELSVFVKNLSHNDKIAQITVLEKDSDDEGDYGIYEIDIYDGITGDVISEGEYKIQGRDLRLDSMVINFEYSEIGAGVQRNLAFPYRIFSNKISPENAIVLESMFTSDNPEELFEKDIESMLGLSRDVFRKRAKEFIEIVKDPLQSQELGIRSAYGNTITIPSNAEEDDEYGIYVEGTGGLSLRKIEW